MSSPLPLAAPEAERALSPASVCFSLHARPEPGVLPRVVELFAKRGLVPHKFTSAVAGQGLTIEVQAAGLDRNVADYMARCMRQIVGIEAVLTCETRTSG